MHLYIGVTGQVQHCCVSEPIGYFPKESLEQIWNSDHVKKVRLQLLNNEKPKACSDCFYKEDVLQSFSLRQTSLKEFGHLVNPEEITLPDGTCTEMKLHYIDFRFSNLCNFKCRMCGDMLSSSWESEQRQHNMIDWSDSKNYWMKPEVKSQITEFQDSQIEQEFSNAVEEHRVEEVYWVGGEPLMYEQHWRYMKRIVELGDGQRVYARYNTNLSRIDYKGTHLYKDILVNIRDWQICASLDGTGPIGEYIRTGLNYTQWLENFKKGLEIQTHRRQMRIDFTLTLPGMFEIKNIQSLAQKLNVDILSKVVFSFSPDIMMSPLILPKNILHTWIDKILLDLHNPVLIEMLNKLKDRPTFQEQWPDSYLMAAKKGKQRILQLEKIRNDKFLFVDIIKQHKPVYEWWNEI